jgi:hypothetical protein
MIKFYQCTEFPIDTLYPYYLVARELGIKAKENSSFVGKLVEIYLNNYLSCLFAGAFRSNHCFAPIKPKIKLSDANKSLFGCFFRLLKA